jgi:hypothetical protein
MYSTIPPLIILLGVGTATDIPGPAKFAVKGPFFVTLYESVISPVYCTEYE